jgi:DHA1 family bicyclomycin/chloramphenicol resistance-like MFS transporter
MTVLSIDISLPAMLQLQQVFGANATSVQLTLGLFLVGFALGQFTTGPISDHCGRRPVLLAGIAIYTLSSLLAASSYSLVMLISARFLQGLGASVGPTMARAIIRDHFDSRAASGVLSQITQIVIIAPLVAPTLGSWMMASFGWPSIFVFLTVGGALLWLVCAHWLPETLLHKQHKSGQLAYAWAGYRQVIAHHQSVRHTLTTSFSFAGMFAYASGAPFVYLTVFEVPEQLFGLYFGMTAISLLLGATFNRAMLKKTEPLHLLQNGIRLLSVASACLLFCSLFGIGGLAGVVGPMMLYLFALGIVQPNATAAAMTPHGNLAGISASLIGGLQTTFGAISGYCVSAFFRDSSLSLAVTISILTLLTVVASNRKTVVIKSARESGLDPTLLSTA